MQRNTPHPENTNLIDEHALNRLANLLNDPDALEKQADTVAAGVAVVAAPTPRVLESLLLAELIEPRAAARLHSMIIQCTILAALATKTACLDA